MLLIVSGNFLRLDGTLTGAENERYQPFQDTSSEQLYRFGPGKSSLRLNKCCLLLI